MASWDFMFSNMKYASNIEIKAYILRADQMCNLFDGNFAEIRQLSRRDLIDKENYLVIRLKNNGHKGAWGNLSITVDDRRIINLEIPFLGVKEANYIIPYDLIFVKDSHMPNIDCTWRKLYAK